MDGWGSKIVIDWGVFGGLGIKIMSVDNFFKI